MIAYALAAAAVAMSVIGTPFSDHEGRAGPPDGRLYPRFMGPPTFARLPRIDQVQDWDVAIVGAPFDIGTSYRPGARFGPIGIRNGAHPAQLASRPRDLSIRVPAGGGRRRHPLQHVCDR